MWRDHGCEIGFHVRTHDADRVDDGLELAGVTDELAGEFGLLDRRMSGHERSHQLEMDATVDRVGEVGFDPLAPCVDRLQAWERATRATLVVTRDFERALDPAPPRVRDDRAWRVQLDLASIELVDPPSLDAMFECILLHPTTARFVARRATDEDLSPPVSAGTRSTGITGGQGPTRWRRHGSSPWPWCVSTQPAAVAGGDRRERR